MSLIDVLNSEMGLGLGLGLSSLVPPAVGYPFGRRIADLIAGLRKSPMVRAVRANQWVIHNEQASPHQLNQLVRDTFRSSARSLYEFWHLYRNPKAILDLVEFEPSAVEVFQRARRGERGTILVSPHTANFDLIGRALVLRGLDLHVLSYPKPPGGYRWQNQIRQIPGMIVTPMSVQALRQAADTLRANKVIITGVDRPLPVPDGKYRPRFFGRPAAMPVFYIRLALKHNLPITILGGCRQPDGRYHVWASEPVVMQRSKDLVQELVENAETVLSLIGDFILKAPEQWAMYYPVWPEAMERMP